MLKQLIRERIALGERIEPDGHANRCDVDERIRAVTHAARVVGDALPEKVRLDRPGTIGGENGDLVGHLPRPWP